MFGTELERIPKFWNFLKFYSSLVSVRDPHVLLSLLPFAASQRRHRIRHYRRVGAIYGLLLAYALSSRTVSFPYLVFPIQPYADDPGRDGVLCVRGRQRGGVAKCDASRRLSWHFYLNRSHEPLGELSYSPLRWKINRVRKEFDVYSGGRADSWDRRVH